ncbi:MAG: PASTA domain-containing protein [Bacteroidetes bacterium]|nr:MAG: PASTA domain-containing protein [Bacteroidota bacterium]
MLKQITHRPLWVNLLVGLLLIIGVFTVFILSLNWLTNHGKSKTIPAVVGKNFDEAMDILKKQGFDVTVQDSIYVDTLPKFTVIKQFPSPDAVVKVNRNVYITVNRAVPPMVEMPNLVNYSFRSAEMGLKNNNLRLGDTTFKPRFDKHTVMEQWYNGAPIAPGTKIRMGSKIDLVLASGVGNLEFSVPDLRGLSYGQAKGMLESNGLVIELMQVDADITDTMNAFIYKQEPSQFDDEGKKIKIRSGQMMNVWLSRERIVIDTATKQLPL